VIVLTATSNTSEAKAAGAVACLFKDADVIDYVRQVVTAPELGASISL